MFRAFHLSPSAPVPSVLTLQSTSHHSANDSSSPLVIDVWKENLQEEMRKIQEFIDKYNYIAMVNNTSN